MFPNIPWEHNVKTPKSQRIRMSREKALTGVIKEYETRKGGRGRTWAERAVWSEMAADRNSDGEWQTQTEGGEFTQGWKDTYIIRGWIMIRQRSLYLTASSAWAAVGEQLHKHEEYQLNVPESLWLLREEEIERQSQTSAGVFLLNNLSIHSVLWEIFIE